MDKNLIKRIIIENQEYVSNLGVVKRNINFEPNANYVFCGIRRCGKSFMQFQKMQSHNQKNCIYVNFEDERLVEFKTSDFDLLLEVSHEICTEKPILLFDEIQNINQWEKFARRLADKGYQVYITGSNAKMLSKDIATTLGGRYFIKEMFPLSFAEYLQFNQITYDGNFEFSAKRFELKKQFELFFKFGGFPELIKYQNPKEYLSSIYLKVFYGDIISRNHIQNEQVLKLLVKKLTESVNNETSLNRIKNLIISTGIKIGNNTITDYLRYLTESYLVFPLINHASAFADRESKKKYYFIDQGVLNLFLLDQETKTLENIVFLQLYKKHKENLFYFKRKLEVDFYVPSENILIQVSYSLAQSETKKREINALLLAMKELKINSAQIITYDEEEIIEVNNMKIYVKPVWKWLLK